MRAFISCFCMVVLLLVSYASELNAQSSGDDYVSKRRRAASEAAERQKVTEQAGGDVFQTEISGGQFNVENDIMLYHQAFNLTDSLQALSGKIYLVRFFRKETPSSLHQILYKGRDRSEDLATVAIKFGSQSVEIMRGGEQELSSYEYKKKGGTSFPCFRSKILPKIQSSKWREGYCFSVAKTVREKNTPPVMIFGDVNISYRSHFFAGLGLLEEISEYQLRTFIEEESRARKAVEQELKALRARGEALPNLDSVDIPGQTREFYEAIYNGKPYQVYKEVEGDPFNSYFNGFLTGMMFLNYHGLYDEYCDLSNMPTTQFTSTRQVWAGSNTTYYPWLRGSIVAQTENKYNSEVVKGPKVQNYAYPTFVATMKRVGDLGAKIVSMGPEGMMFMQRQAWLSNEVSPYAVAMRNIIKTEGCTSPTWKRLGDGFDVVTGIKNASIDNTSVPKTTSQTIEQHQKAKPSSTTASAQASSTQRPPQPAINLQPQAQQVDNPTVKNALYANAGNGVTPSTLSAEVKQLVLISQRSLPNMDNPTTRFDAIEFGSGNELIFKFTSMDVVRQGVNFDAVAAGLAQNSANVVSQNSGYAAIRNNRTTIRFQYYDKVGVFIGEYTISPR